MVSLLIYLLDIFFHNVEKWPNMLQKSCGVYTARISKVCLTTFEQYERKD